MHQLDGNRFPAVLLVLIGLAVVFHAVQTNPLGSREAMSVRGAHEGDLRDIQQELNFTELTPEGQDAFSRGLRTGMVEFDTWEEPPPDFTYVDVTYRYLVRHQGDLYVVATWGVGGFPFLRLGAWIFLVTSGGVLALLGLFSYRRGWFREPVTVLVALTMLYLTFHFEIYILSPNTQLVLALGVLITIFPAVVAWIALGRISD